MHIMIVKQYFIYRHSIIQNNENVDKASKEIAKINIEKFKIRIYADIKNQTYLFTKEGQNMEKTKSKNE